VKRPDVRQWTADQHKAAGDELLAQSIDVLTGEDPGNDPEVIERVEASAGHLAAVAAAHYAAAQLILVKHQVAEVGSVDSRWNWRGTTV
jgi:hypothetical protein